MFTIQERNPPRPAAQSVAGLIVPRPIGWISTISRDGVPNLAPYSCFNALASNPPFVMFSSDSPKDSVTNAEETGFFCVNIATYPCGRP